MAPQAPLISLNSIGLDPASDDEDAWPTEVFTEEAGLQLKRLSAFFAEPSSSSARALFTEDVTFEAFRPSNLATVFEDERFLIRRSVENAEQQQSGIVALQSAVEGFGSLRSEFKIHDVQAEANSIKTKIAVILSGQDGSGQVQDSSTWTCGWTKEHPPLLRSIQVGDYQSSLAKGEMSFNDCTEAVFEGVPAYDDQLAFSIDHWAARIESVFGLNISGWEGLALGDVNGDGLDDVYVCQPGGLPNRLFIQKADGTVFDASSFAGVNWRIQSQSALFVDLDNDGDQDLAIATTLGVIIMANDGRGTFAVKASPLIPHAAPMALSSADFDLDGDLDLYATCYSPRRVNSNSAILGRPMPYHDANNGGRNVLFRNDRGWKFTNATLEVGLDSNNRRFSFAASWEDYDNDGDPDLYVANDYGRNNLYRNDRTVDGAHTFTDIAKEAGVEDISAGMSVSWGDYNLDGWMDLYVSNMWSSAGNRVTFQRQFQSGANVQTLTDMQRHARGNSLFMNAGDGTFQDVSVAQGVTMGRWAWGSRFVDLNTDGYDDILVANGFITQPDDTGDL